MADRATKIASITKALPSASKGALDQILRILDGDTGGRVLKQTLSGALALEEAACDELDL